MELEDRLASAFLVDLPPVVDTHFTIAVMEAHARRELVESLLLLGGLSLIGAVLLAALAPAAGPVIEQWSRDIVPYLGLLAAGLCIAVFATGQTDQFWRPRL